MVRPARRTAQNCESVELHGSSVNRVCRVVQDVTEDGRVDPHERELLRSVLEDMQISYAPLPKNASLIDNGARLLKALADTMDVTPWVERMARECAEDEAALSAA